jgi:hypothetical protein
LIVPTDPENNIDRQTIIEWFLEAELPPLSQLSKPPGLQFKPFLSGVTKLAANSKHHAFRNHHQRSATAGQVTKRMHPRPRRLKMLIQVFFRHIGSRPVNPGRVFIFIDQ